MNTLKQLACLSLLVSLGACNEKVSPELQGGAAASVTTGGGTSTPVTPDEFYFRVVNNADTMLNFKLHKTGVNNAATECKISNTIGLSSNSYRSDPGTYDITCFYEAEEFALGYNGLSFGIEASKNTCDFVGYTPFSYYSRLPGSSTDSLVEVDCPAENPPTQANIDAVVSSSATGLGCGMMRSLSIPAGSFAAPAADADLCAFDYSSQGGPNCDSGSIIISKTMVTMTDTNNDGNVDTPIPKTTTRRVTCGGRALNCVDGPVKDESVSGALVMKYTQTTLNKEFTMDKTYAGVLEKTGSNLKYVNFRRDLASLEIEYGNSNRNGFTTPLSTAYLSSWGDPTYKYTYNPELMALYSNNQRMDGTPLVTTAMQSAAALLNGNKRETPLAAEPFLGISGKTSPFYVAYCLDNALDVKARIRMVVRDWDRVHSTSLTDKSFERISDVDLLPPLARQDVPYTVEITGEPDSWNEFNDIFDWDDIIDMERDDAGIGYDPSVTIWRPYPVAPYTAPTTNGFFNPSYFPN